MSTMDQQITAMLKIAGKQLGHMANCSDEVTKAIINNSIGAAAASLASGWLPGVGALAATAVSAGFIWRMYFQINKALGISISKNILKSLASALLTNLVAQLGGVVLIEVTATAISLIPGIGNVSASILLGAVNYGIVYVSGLVYIKMLTGLFSAQKDINSMTEEDFKASATETFNQNKEEFQKAFHAARESAKEDIKRGNITKDNTFDPETDD